MSWRNTREYRVWRAQVIRRDSRCVICGSLQNRHAHHKNHATYFPELRFEVENGVCLCSGCHSQFHNNFKRSTRVKCTEYDFNNFVDISNYFKEKMSEN